MNNMFALEMTLNQMIAFTNTLCIIFNGKCLRSQKAWALPIDTDGRMGQGVETLRVKL